MEGDWRASVSAGCSSSASAAPVSPDKFWSGQLDLPEGTELSVVAPSADGTRGVCVFKSDSVNTVRDLVEGAAGAVSTNEYFAINEGSAHGLPV